jgi:hypothetical protein
MKKVGKARTLSIGRLQCCLEPIECMAHVLNLGAQQILKELKQPVGHIRSWLGLNLEMAQIHEYSANS